MLWPLSRSAGLEIVWKVIDKSFFPKFRSFSKFRDTIFPRFWRNVQCLSWLRRISIFAYGASFVFLKKIFISCRETYTRIITVIPDYCWSSMTMWWYRPVDRRKDTLHLNFTPQRLLVLARRNLLAIIPTFENNLSAGKVWGTAVFRVLLKLPSLPRYGMG